MICSDASFQSQDALVTSRIVLFLITLPETKIAHENPIFPGKYHQNCGFSMAMLVSGSVFLFIFRLGDLGICINPVFATVTGRGSIFKLRCTCVFTCSELVVALEPPVNVTFKTRVFGVFFP